jgi:AcrR family transcriptional regulator
MADPTHPRGAYAKTGRFRAEVLDAALGIVAEQGFDAATLQLIADAVGRSKAGLLHHFGTRERLMLDIVRHRDETDSELFPPDPAGSFSATIDLTAHNATVPGLIALFTVVAALAAADTTATERREFFAARYARTRAGLARRIAGAQALGRIRDDIHPDTAATLLVGAMDGLQTQWLLDDSIDMARHLRALVDWWAPDGSGGAARP